MYLIYFQNISGVFMFKIVQKYPKNDKFWHIIDRRWPIEHIQLDVLAKKGVTILGKLMLYQF